VNGIDIAATVSAVAALITAIGAFAVAWRNSKKADRAKVEAAVTEQKRLSAIEEARVKAAVAAAAASAAKIAAEDSNARIIRIGDEIFQLGKRVDGRLSELLDATKAQAHAEGVTQGEADERGRVGGPKPT
jgi:replicative DNA helicase